MIGIDALFLPRQYSGAPVPQRRPDDERHQARHWGREALEFAICVPFGVLVAIAARHHWVFRRYTRSFDVEIWFGLLIVLATVLARSAEAIRRPWANKCMNSAHVVVVSCAVVVAVIAALHTGGIFEISFAGLLLGGATQAAVGHVHTLRRRRHATEPSPLS